IDDESVFEDEKGEAETLAGFVLEISKSFPKINSEINFKTYTFTVEALSNKRIKQLKVTLKK
ncbi:gliding motility-associated protein GldE, partial [Flavobacteriaceae bacterium]|nr:gliding motility-associated protein GldE [Flavobacteriaceae bacterium]